VRLGTWAGPKISQNFLGPCELFLGPLELGAHQTFRHFIFFDWYRRPRMTTFISPRWTSFLHNSLSIHYTSHSLDSATDRIDSVSKAPSHATNYIDRINSNFPAPLRKFSLNNRRGREHGDALLNRDFEDHVVHVMFLPRVSRDLDLPSK
jgi:hypothetical protein